MGFREHCKSLGIELRDEDMRLIKWKLRMLPEIIHKHVLEKYINVYFEALEKEHPNNYAGKGNARHYANRFIKFYR